MINWSNQAVDNTSSEQNHNLLMQQFKQLADIKQLLEEPGHMHDVTEDFILHILSQLYEVSKAIRAIPDDISQMYIASRDAFLNSLRNATIELNLTLEQLATKGKTRRFYKTFLSCLDHLEKALEQKGRSVPCWQEQSQHTNSVASNEWPGMAKRSMNFYAQTGQYRADIVAMGDRLEYLSRLFSAESDIWPDQCETAIALFQTIRTPLQGLCTLLEVSPQFSLPVTSHYCCLIVTLHHSDQQIHEALVLLAAYRSMCRSSSVRAMNKRQDIARTIELLEQNNETILQNLPLLLDQAHFQEHLSHHLRSISLQG